MHGFLLHQLRLRLEILKASPVQGLLDGQRFLLRQLGVALPLRLRDGGGPRRLYRGERSQIPARGLGRVPRAQLVLHRPQVHVGVRQPLERSRNVQARVERKLHRRWLRRLHALLLVVQATQQQGVGAGGEAAACATARDSSARRASLSHTSVVPARYIDIPRHRCVVRRSLPSPSSAFLRKSSVLCRLRLGAAPRRHASPVVALSIRRVRNDGYFAAG
mmetsp:Transcript_37199/g.71337  ORF Transcript_37199/g.71337 Transcript_37199/m.71337 type:complete len:219 (-) Transcript_37199:862-1518(-)